MRRACLVLDDTWEKDQESGSQIWHQRKRFNTESHWQVHFSWCLDGVWIWNFIFHPFFCQLQLVEETGVPGKKYIPPSHCQSYHMPRWVFKPWQCWEIASSQWQRLRPHQYQGRPSVVRAVSGNTLDNSAIRAGPVLMEVARNDLKVHLASTLCVHLSDDSHVMK